MGSKNDPGKFDCYTKALPDEPIFVMLARDPDFEEFVAAWAHRRQLKINCGDRPEEDHDMVLEAYDCAFKGAEWRRQNNGKWRSQKKE